jgi:hypothetical protein
MNAGSFLIGAATGSALMFMLDPNGGGRRRARVRDQMVRATRTTRDGLDATVRDISNRGRGIAAAARGRWSNAPVTDDVLVERVRARIGRVCSHPHAIEVDAHDGQVTVRGPVLAAEADRLIATAGSVPGVASVMDQLERHTRTEGIPALQGEGRIAGSSLDILQSRWAPGTRAMVGAGLLATGLFVAMGARRAGGERWPASPEYSGA